MKLRAVVIVYIMFLLASCSIKSVNILEDNEINTSCKIVKENVEVTYIGEKVKSKYISNVVRKHHGNVAVITDPNFGVWVGDGPNGAVGGGVIKIAIYNCKFE